MRAIVQDVYGGPEVLRMAEVSRPAPGPLDLLVRVHAVSVNPVDAKVRGGGPAGAPVTNPPQIVGWDAAGVVAAVGDAVERFSVGDEVFFAGDVTRRGSYAQYVAVDERIVGYKPGRLSFEEAAAIPLTALTAWEGLVEMIQAQQPADATRRTLLVVGGAGGVGSITIQIARQLCHLHVIATASRPETADYCRQLGAVEIIDHSQDFAPQLAALGFPGVDYIFSAAPLTNFPQLVASLNPLGKICCILGGEPAQQLDVSGLFPIRGTLAFELMFTRPRLGIEPEKQGEILDRVADLLDAGVLVTTMQQILPWTEVHEAHRQIESGRTIGKIVLRVEQ
jgi:NADPH:quinone reductase